MKKSSHKRETHGIDLRDRKIEGRPKVEWEEHHVETEAETGMI